MAFFGKKEKGLSETNIATIISDACQIDGNIKSTNSIKIDGTVNGNIELSKGLILGDKGKVIGNVKANEAVIYGHIQGDISTKKLEIKASGKINGNISTETIEMEFGSVYNGKVTMDKQSNHGQNRETPVSDKKPVLENEFVQKVN